MNLQAQIHTAASLYALAEPSDPFAYRRKLAELKGVWSRNPQRGLQDVRDTIEIAAGQLHMDVKAAERMAWHK